MAIKSALTKSPSKGRVTSMPVGKAPANGAAAAATKTAQGAGLQRLSPGVYRNAQGSLVGNKGQALPGQAPRGGGLADSLRKPVQRPSMNPAMPQPAAPPPAAPPPAAAPAPAGEAIAAADQAGQQMPQQQMPSWRRPAPMGQNGQMPGMEYSGMPQEPMRSSQVMPDRGFQGSTSIWAGLGNGPGSPYDVNPQYGQKPMPNMGFERTADGQPPVALRDMIQKYMMSQQQQPGSVSGILQQGGQPQPMGAPQGMQNADLNQNNSNMPGMQFNPYMGKRFF